MIEYKKGNLLEAEDCEAIMHQVNCMGAFGKGIAKQIKDKWPDSIYTKYKNACNYCTNKKELLGKVQIVETNDYDSNIKYVINLFSQYAYGEKYTPFIDNRHTDYNALVECLNKVRDYCVQYDIKTVGMPKYMCCGLAGGDWTIVEAIINSIFKTEQNITLYIYEI